MKVNIAIALLLTLLLAACAAPTPEQPPAATSAPEATSTPEATLTPSATPRPDSKELAIRLANLTDTFRPGTTPTAEAEICSFSFEDVCASMSEWVDDRILAAYDKYPSWPGSAPIIESVELRYEGFMSDGTEYQAWAIKGQHGNYPGTKENGHLLEFYPVFTWDEDEIRWKLFRYPYEWDAKTMHLCGQFVSHESYGFGYDEVGYQAIWDMCLTATPPPPTPAP